ncbi:hypothetical protein GUJ93_ZPchr0012g19870 [Zizania palustris]|uniref:Uncharacterized protein n=1 Tax=Zizania palustris TaxID=103762 RepID=A0A8J5WMP2_ZIZPA|nr:hypothetical protein GUJ93_ZPchr0012g19870 [Zizania palustris]
MVNDSVKPNEFPISLVLNACAQSGVIEQGFMIKFGLGADRFFKVVELCQDMHQVDMAMDVVTLRVIAGVAAIILGAKPSFGPHKSRECLSL